MGKDEETEFSQITTPRGGGLNGLALKGAFG